MKRIILTALGLAISVSAASAATNVVLSRNAVGYVRIDLIATNKLHLIRNDFVGLNAPIAISNALASLPPGTQVILWDKSNQVYQSAIIKSANPLVGWGPGGSNRLERGASFFIRTPNAATNVSTIPLFLMGEVPDKFTAPTTTLTVVQGLNMVGYPYPVSRPWTNTTLAQQLPAGSQIITWNATNQSYNPAIIRPSNPALGWGPLGNALQISPGQGFFIRATNALVYSEAKPYTWP
jgi:hypothetical protein